MDSPLLILVLGMPATGKTTLAKQLSSHLELPLFCRDSIKERIFDELGGRDREWSMKVGGAAHRILDDIIEQHLTTSRSLIVEGTFNPKLDNGRFRSWQQQHGVTYVQVFCHAQKRVILERFKERALSERHPGHAEIEHMQQFLDQLSQAQTTPLDIHGRVLRIDTTDFSTVNPAHIASIIKSS